MCSETAWSIPCCTAVSASFSVERPLSAVGAPLCELGDDGAEGEAEESGAACTYKDGESQQCNLRQINSTL